MIYGNRVTELRKKLSLSKRDLAIRVGVSTATITNWENWKSMPTIMNLKFLAKALNTTPAYLEGMTDIAFLPPIPAETEKTPPNPTQPGLCEDCGTPVPERLRKCPSCRWKTRWPETLLNSSRLATRRKRSHSTQLLSLDREKPEAIFGSSTDKNRTTYITTLETCTCRDFELTHGEIPCKHILRLAGEMGFFQSEYFAAGEDDYTMHVAPSPETVTPNPVFVDKPIDEPSYLPSEPLKTETTPELPDSVNPAPPKILRSPGILTKLLKYALCCFFGFWAIVFILLAVKGDKTALCFPVAFAIAGLLTASTARRNALEGSAFSWWLYGALVPVASWVDVVMACSQNRTKGFVRGVIYSLLGIAAFLIVFVQFLPAVPKP